MVTCPVRWTPLLKTSLPDLDPSKSDTRPSSLQSPGTLPSHQSSATVCVLGHDQGPEPRLELLPWPWEVRATVARRFCPAAGHSLFTSLIWGWGSSQVTSANHHPRQGPTTAPPLPQVLRALRNTHWVQRKLPPAHWVPGGNRVQRPRPGLCRQGCTPRMRAPVPASLRALSTVTKGSTVTREARAGSGRKVASRAQEKNNFYSFKKM